jgi:hypothetical protein
VAAKKSTADTPVAASAPFAFHDGSSFEYCFPTPGSYLVVEQVTPTRAVVLSAPTLVAATGTTITGSWVAAAPEGTEAMDGGFLIPASLPLPSEVVAAGWKDRMPMAEALVEAGTTYTLFTETEIQPDGRFDGIDFRWNDESATGIVTKAAAVRHRAACP